MGAELDNVESRPGNKFEREIERLRGLDCLRHAGGYSRVTQPAKSPLVPGECPWLVDSICLARSARRDRYADIRGMQDSRSRLHNGP